MRAVFHRCSRDNFFLIFQISVLCSSRRLSAYWNQLDLNRLQTFSIPGSACRFSVLGQSQPAKGLSMYGIINSIILSCGSRKLDFDGFQSLSFSRSACHCSVRNKVLPTVGLDMGAVLNASFCAAAQFNGNSFQTLLLAGGS